MKCVCKICGIDFDASPMWHHKEGICSDHCRKTARMIVEKKYKKTEKGKAAEIRWRKNPAKKEIDKRYMQKPEAKAKSVIRANRYLANHSHIRERRRELNRIWGKTEHGRTVKNAAQKRYRETDYGKLMRKKIKMQRRGATGSFTPEEWNMKLKTCGSRCVFCGSLERIEIDHIVPISKGGTNDIENLQPLCRRCNSSKGNR